MKRNRQLTIRQLQVMAALKGHPEASLRELGTILGCTHVSVLDVLRALERGGYVTPTTRVLTKAGIEALTGAVDELRATLQQLQAA